MGSVYALIELDYANIEFKGVHATLDEATKHATPHATIFKAILGGAVEECPRKPNLFLIKINEQGEYRELGRIVGLESVKCFIRKYCEKQYTGMHDEWSLVEGAMSVGVEIYTAKVIKPVKGESYLRGGVKLATITTEVLNYKYEEPCESAISTNS